MSSPKLSRRDILALAAKGAVLGAAAPAFAGPGLMFQRAGDHWSTTTTTSAPTARERAGGVWSGTEMIVWGGLTGLSSVTNTGGRYDPVTNTWAATTATGAPTARGYFAYVWTGSKFIVWGGSTLSAALNTGGQYDPVANSWTATTTTSAPGARVPGDAVWTGTEMIVWGGSSYNFSTLYNTGARYNPTSNTWTAMSTTGAPSAREQHSAIWTGTEMIVFGGYNGSASLNDGYKYNPSTNTWSTISSTGAPAARDGHVAVWTGSKMIVWGGFGALTTGGIYDPAANTWSAMSTTGVPTGRNRAAGVWTGHRLVVWGGVNTSWTTCYNTGGVYNPDNNTWSSATSTTGAPSARHSSAIVYTGREMIVWGGYNESSWFNTGGKFRPLQS